MDLKSQCDIIYKTRARSEDQYDLTDLRFYHYPTVKASMYVRIAFLVYNTLFIVFSRLVMGGGEKSWFILP